MTIGFIAWLTLREAGRRRILWIGAGLGLVFLLFFAAGLQALIRQLPADYDLGSAQSRESASFITMAGLYAVNFLVAMLSVLASVDTISGEIATHSIQSLVTKPIRRSDVVLGKWLGFALLVLAATALLGGGVIAIASAVTGYMVPNWPAGLALMSLQGLVLLSLTVMGGTRFSTLSNGVLAFMLFAIAFVGGWTEQFGALLNSEAAVRVGIVTSLILPTEAIWRRASSLMQPPLLQTFASSPFAVISEPSAAMMVYSVLYMAALVALAVRSFSRRDL
jgi:Cu-processing system permease protein